LLPHEFLAAVARGEAIGGYSPSFTERMAAASQAAPSYAPKLASVAQSIDSTVGLHNLSDADLRARAQQLIAKALDQATAK
jgi:hypothetical protein